MFIHIQVILNSMYGLFQMTEMSTIKLFESIHNIAIPDEWETVDLIKQTSSLMHSSSNPALADELLFVRKAQAIIEFCLECKSLLKAFKLEKKSSNDRKYDIETVLIVTVSRILSGAFQQLTSRIL